MSLEPLSLDESEPCMCNVPLDLFDWIYRVLMGYPTYITWHVFWHAPSSILDNVQVIT